MSGGSGRGDSTKRIRVCSSFVITGDPTATGGGLWSYTSTDDGTYFEITGSIRYPDTNGPYPAVIAHHGNSGNTSMGIADIMVNWGTGLVIIAPDYVHNPTNAPVSPNDGLKGANEANMIIARKALDLLNCLSFVDTSKLATHGYSLGAYLNILVAARYGDILTVASHVAGGINDAYDGTPWGPGAAATSAMAADITTPYCWFHGTADTAIDVQQDRDFTDAMPAGTTKDSLEFPGSAHEIVLSVPGNAFIESFYDDNGLF